MLFPKIQGIARDKDDEWILVLHPARRLTDDEMRTLHDYLNNPYCQSEYELRERPKHANAN